MTSVSKYMYIGELDDIVNKYNNTYHSKIKMKPVNVKPSIYVDFDKNKNKEGPKFKVGNNVQTSKYKITFARDYVQNWSEEVFVIKKVKNTVPWTYVISDFNGEEIIGTFYEKEFQKTNPKDFRFEKVINRKGDKLYVKLRGYDNFLIVDKKDMT